MAMRKIKLALLGGAQASHADEFSGIFNSREWHNHAEAQGYLPMPAEARVIRVWDRNPAEAGKLASSRGIERVCGSIPEALAGVDGAILADDCVPSQHLLAPAVIESGVPFFLDKPLAPTGPEAEKIVRLAKQKGALMFSSSALRYCRELEEIKPQLEKEGGVQLTTASGPDGRLMFYGIHPLELTVTAMGTGIQNALNLGSGLANQIRFDWADGRQALLCVDQRVKGISAVFHTKERSHFIRVSDHRYFYYYLMRRFILMIMERELPVPLEETLEIIRFLHQAEHAPAA